MGDIKLLQQPRGSIGFDELCFVIYRSGVGFVDDLGKEIIEMGEFRLLLVVLGIPAYIFAWFIDIGKDYEPAKGIILTAIVAFSGIVLGLRYLVKLLTEIKEFMNKYYPSKKKR